VNAVTTVYIVNLRVSIICILQFLRKCVNKRKCHNVKKIYNEVVSRGKEKQQFIPDTGAVHKHGTVVCAILHSQTWHGCLCHFAFTNMARLFVPLYIHKHGKFACATSHLETCFNYILLLP